MCVFRTNTFFSKRSLLLFEFRSLGPWGAEAGSTITTIYRCGPQITIFLRRSLRLNPKAGACVVCCVQLLSLGKGAQPLRCRFCIGVEGDYQQATANHTTIETESKLIPFVLGLSSS